MLPALAFPPLWSGDALREMFGLSLPILEKMLRPVIVYLFLVIGLRLAGKRELAQLNPFDLVVLLSLSNTVQNAIIGEDNSITGGLLGATTLLAVNYFVVRFVFKHRRLDQMIEGTPTTLIEGGEVRKEALALELLTETELQTVAHRQGFATLAEVESCVLEPGGSFYMKGKEPAQEQKRHEELMRRMDELTTQLSDLQRQLRHS